MRIPILLASLVFVPLVNAAPATQPTTQPVHDRDPWIFRCVLDGNARMVVVSLGDHYWAAYDAEHCALAKVWRGDVELTGAVYDMRHGPQPKAKGKILLDRSAATSRPGPQIVTDWKKDPDGQGFSFTNMPDPAVGDGFTYRGYSQRNGVATFHFEHQDPRYDGDKQLRIDETPTIAVNADGTAILRRTIQVTFAETNRPMALPVRITLPTSGSVAEIRLVEGDASHVPDPGVLQANPLKAPAAIPFDATKNCQLIVSKSGTPVIDTEFKPADQQTAPSK